MSIRDRALEATRDHPEADARLTRAADLLDAAVLSESAIDQELWNEAGAVIEDVCGAS